MEGDFSYMSLKDSEKENLRDAYDAVSRAKQWEWLKTVHVESFMFCNAPELASINKELKGNYSFASYAFAIRSMERIAKFGWMQFALDNITTF